MKIYISGAMTGTDDYMERFAKAEKLLRERNPAADIINPTKVLAPLPEGTSWGQYMDIALNVLRGCDAVYMLTGWEKSTGAQMERLYAEGCGMAVAEEESYRLFSVGDEVRIKRSTEHSKYGVVRRVTDSGDGVWVFGTNYDSFYSDNQIERTGRNFADETLGEILRKLGEHDKGAGKGKEG